MKSSAQISTKVLSATLLISLISASQSEACGNSKKNPMEDIAAACAAATNGVKADGKANGIIKVTKLDQPEAAVAGVKVSYSEGGNKFITNSSGGLISKCHVLTVAHALPHPISAYEEGLSGSSLNGGANGVRPNFNPFEVGTSELNGKMKVEVTTASSSGVSVNEGEIAGLIQQNGTRLGPAQDLMVVRLKKSVKGIVPMELDREQLPNEDIFESNAFSLDNKKGGLFVKKQACQGLVTGAASFLDSPNKVQYNCLSLDGDSGGFMTRTSEKGDLKKRVLTSILAVGPKEGEDVTNVRVSTTVGPYVKAHIGSIEQWMRDYPCED